MPVNPLQHKIEPESYTAENTRPVLENKLSESLTAPEKGGEPVKQEITPLQEGEVGIERTQIKPEEKEGFLEETIGGLRQKLRNSIKKQTSIPQIKDELTKEIENAMAEGLSDVYKELNTIQKQEFKIKGEETAFQIRQIFKQAHVKAKTVFQLILEWLKMLPGINRFFLEQEAKIKTDKILALKDKHRN